MHCRVSASEQSALAPLQPGKGDGCGGVPRVVDMELNEIEFQCQHLWPKKLPPLAPVRVRLSFFLKCRTSFHQAMITQTKERIMDFFFVFLGLAFVLGGIYYIKKTAE